MNRTSKELDQAQETIEAILCDCIQAPMKQWKLINQYLAILKDVDSRRRKAWHEEKFGVYEEIADEMPHIANFTTDDIPF